MAQQRTLLSNATASGSLVDWPGGQGVFAVTATAWAAATVKLQFLGPDGASLIDAGAATTFTGNNAGIFSLPPGKIQATIVGGPPTGVNASAGVVAS